MTLFFGNGINRFSDGYSWKDVIMFLCREFNINTKIIENIPFPILYENIFFKSGHSYKKENSRVKSIIIDKLIQINHNHFHKDFISIKSVDDIITTNYDYNFEYGSGLNKKEIDKNTIETYDSKYNVFRYTKSHNDTRVWHVHGNANDLYSIILGYEQYTGQIEKIRNIITKSNEIDLIRNSWMVKFLYDTVVFLGFNLNYSEMDIWWLLTYRRRKKNFRKAYSKGKINKMIFIAPKFEYEEKRNFYKVLENFGVDLKIYDVESYYELYIQSIEDIKSKKILSTK